MPCGCAGPYLPGAGLTLVTGRGTSTGSKTFLAVGKLLSSLMGTVVSGYVAHDSCGAYTVWLLHPPDGECFLLPVAAYAQVLACTCLAFVLTGFCSALCATGSLVAWVMQTRQHASTLLPDACFLSLYEMEV